MISYKERRDALLELADRLSEMGEDDGVCGYFGLEYGMCGKCPADGEQCVNAMARDVSRRIRDAVDAREGGSDAPRTGDDGQGGTDAHADEGEAADGAITPSIEVLRLVKDNGGIEAVKKRLMPDGMEWPRYEDGEPARIGDEVKTFNHGQSSHITSISFDSRGAHIGYRWNGKDDYTTISASMLERSQVLAADGEPLDVGQTVYAKNYGYVKCTVLAIEWVVDGYLVEVENEGGHKFRQTPDEFTHQRPVLDADGEEIGIGDKLYDTETGCARIVRAINANGTVEFEGHEDRGWFTRFLTHRAPVIAADGKPLRKGETVWHVKTGREYVVVEPSYGETVVVRLAKYDDAEGEQYAPSQLTHERPDSWERLEEDAGKDCCAYYGNDPWTGCDGCPAKGVEDCNSKMASDIVRRAKALAERDA